MIVYLIRHARTEDAKKGLTQRYNSVILNDKQVQEEAKSIRLKVGNVDAVYCSPMKRAVQTAELIFGKCKPEVLKDIYEYPQPKEILDVSRAEAFNYWEVLHKDDKLDINWVPTEGESFHHIAQRVRKFHTYVLDLRDTKNYQKIAVVGHGTFFRHYLLCATGVSWEKQPELIFDVLRKLSWDNLQVVDVEV